MKKRIGAIFTILALAVAFALPASAQFVVIQKGPITAAVSGPGIGVDTQTGQLYYCNGPCLGGDATIGVFQGVTATSITTGAFTSLTGPNLKISNGEANVLNKHFRIRGRGVYTTGAASVVNVQVLLCQASNACGGTTVAPAGCVVVATNQANVIANAQFSFECELTTAATGSSGTAMAKATAWFNLGATTASVMSSFMDTATAVSAAVDWTQDEYVVPQFKFTTSNAGNAATLQQMTIEQLN
jgi:hypothetical protein